MKTPKPISHDSYNEGAAEERRLWMRRIKRLKRYELDARAYAIFKSLVEYGEGRIKRNGLKKGGL